MHPNHPNKVVPVPGDNKLIDMLLGIALGSCLFGVPSSVIAGYHHWNILWSFVSAFIGGVMGVLVIKFRNRVR